MAMEIWDTVRDFLPAGKRGDIAVSLFRSLQEYGFDGKDLNDLLDEDEHLTAAHKVVFGTDFEEHEEDSDAEPWED